VTVPVSMLVSITARAGAFSNENDLPGEHVGDGDHHADWPEAGWVGRLQIQQTLHRICYRPLFTEATLH
jgi:hypothetical protein